MVVKLFEGKRRPFLSVLQRLSRGQSRSKHGASAVMRFRMLRLGTRGLLAYQMRGHSWLCMKIVVVLLVVPVPHAYWTELCKLARRAQYYYVDPATNRGGSRLHVTHVT